MYKPLVSIIMPCFNAAKYISTAIKSVIDQTLKPWELILINDGSTDDTEAEILKFTDPRIHYYKQENKGQCAASNLGIEKATGDYIKFFDADDIMNPEHLEAQLIRLDGSKSNIASCAWGAFYDGNPASAVFESESVWKDMETLDWLKASLTQKYDMLGAWLWLIPKEILQKAGGWNEHLSLSNDFEFSIRLLLNAEKVLFTPEAKMYYRLGLTEALSQNYSKDKLEAAIHSTDLGCQYLVSAEDSREMRLLCANRYQEWMYRVYPKYPEIVRSLEEKIKRLGGSTRKMDGGKVARVLTTFLGWKNTKSLHLKLKKAGYKKLPFN